MLKFSVLKQIGGTAILTGVLGLVPLAASAATTSKQDISPPMFKADMAGSETFQSNLSSKGEVLVPRVGYVDIRDYGAEPHHMAENNAHDFGMVLVPKAGYVDVNSMS